MVEVVACPRDPEMQTALRCNYCGTPICPRCMVQAPVGARCKDCARPMKSPIYTLTRQGILGALLACVLGGIVMGIIWLLVLIPFQFGFLSIFIGVFLSFVFTRALDFATGRKRGPVVVAFAIAGMLIAWSFTVPVLGLQAALYGLFAVGVGALLAYQRLISV